jgi:hypothetical protein
MQSILQHHTLFCKMNFNIFPQFPPKIFRRLPNSAIFYNNSSFGKPMTKTTGLFSPKNLNHLDTVHRLKMCNTCDVSGDVPTTVSRFCVVRTTYISTCTIKIFQYEIGKHILDRLCPSPYHTSLCGVDIHVITDSTYFCYSSWCFLPLQPPASTILRKSLQQEVWRPDQSLNTIIQQCLFQKTMQNFVTECCSYISVYFCVCYCFPARRMASSSTRFSLSHKTTRHSR